MGGGRGLGREVFTTGQVADICHVAPRTVSKWFDGGKLEGYRIPGSNDRRIPRDSLLRFMRKNGLEVPPGLASLETVACLGLSPAEVEAVRALGVEAVACASPLEAGRLLERAPRSWLAATVVGLATVEVAQAMAATPQALLLVLPEDMPKPPARCEGWRRVVRQPVAPAALALAVVQAMRQDEEALRLRREQLEKARQKVAALEREAQAAPQPGQGVARRRCKRCRVLFVPAAGRQRTCVYGGCVAAARQDRDALERLLAVQQEGAA